MPVAMLAELSITNFAIIEHVQLLLRPGLNVLTGETGAGKSILIDAVSGLLGGRLGADLVRAGESHGRVEGVFSFDTPDQDLIAALEEAGLTIDDGQLIVARDLSATGRGTSRVNGRAVPTSVLASLAPHLIDIHGQSENESLVRPGVQLALLDAYAGLSARRAIFAGKVAEARQLRRDLAALVRDDRDRARTLDLLRFQSEEIASASIRVGEDLELEAELKRLTNAEKLIGLAESSYAAFYEGSDEKPSAVEQLDAVADALAEIARLDPTLGDTARQIREMALQAADLARDVHTYRERVDVDAERLTAVEERLEVLRGLKRKYGPTLEDVVAFDARVSSELTSLENADSHAQELRAQEQSTMAEIGQIACILSEKRNAAAIELGTAIEAELHYLNLTRARFAIRIENTEAEDGVVGPDNRTYAFDMTGIDRVVFDVAPNPGEPLRPLARIASGGETSRIMLALKAVLASVDRVPVLIFDEVDSGIGGRSGGVIGEKLAELARQHQVICVTHLPQIACFAETHFRIEKVVEGERTRTTVSRLDDEARVEELAAMLGGVRHGLDHARSLWNDARAILLSAN